MIVDAYFKKHTFADHAQESIDEVTKQLEFRIDRPLFRGMIYDNSRLGSIIYKGRWKGKDAVLKIQGLRLPRDEKDIIDGFLEQNGSARIRMPKIYSHKPWDEERGYGYLLMEYIPDQPLFSLPLPTQEEITTFLSFFTELKTRSITAPWITQTEQEQSSTRLIRHRLTQWVAIAKDRGHFDESALVPRIQTFNEQLEQFPKEIPMAFMHAHMTGREVRQLHDTKQFVVFSNLYWGWRPKWYDCAFIIWSLLQQPEVYLNVHDILNCIHEWKRRFTALPWIASDSAFSEIFDFLILERLIGTLIIDINVQQHEDARRKQKREALMHAFDELARQT